MSYRIQFWILLFFRKILLALPESARFRFGDAMGRLAYRVIKSRRITALWNLRLAFPEKTEEEREALALKSFQIMIKYFLSTFWYEDYLKEHVTVMEPEKIDKVYAQGRGVMLAAIHMGNIETSAKVQGKHPGVTIAKAQRNPYINQFIIDNRQALFNINLIMKTKHSARALQKFLEDDKQKYLFALFSDHRDKGAKVNFFGRQTVAPTGAVGLAYKYDMPLCIIYSCMNDDNSSTVYMSDEFPLQRTEEQKKDIRENTQRMITQMEAIIRKHPEQWMWFHDRWNLYRDYRKEGIFPPFITEEEKKNYKIYKVKKQTKKRRKRR